MGKCCVLYIDNYGIIHNPSFCWWWKVLNAFFFFSFRIPLCSLINQHLVNLSQKFPQTKFIKSVSSVCIPNYPDKNLPTIFVYFEGELKKQFVGPFVFGGMKLTIEGKYNLWHPPTHTHLWEFSIILNIQTKYEQCDFFSLLLYSSI